MAYNVHDETYNTLVEDILTIGEENSDRTGVGTISVFGRMLRFDLRSTFPLLTTKKVNWKPVLSELLWFIEGSGDERRLAELRYGKDRSELKDKTTIWTENANAPYWKPKAKFEGDLGEVYGKQWRAWKAPTEPVVGFDENLEISSVTSAKEIDQLSTLINELKTNPTSRRHIITAWNPGALDQMALPPCHMMAQFKVSKDGELSCLLTQRSMDAFLGAPFNIASYALFTKMIAQVCDLTPGELIISMGDAHIYLNHIEQMKEQLTRSSFQAPVVLLDPSVKNIEDFTMDNIQLVNYEHHAAIKGAMAV